MIHHTFFVVDSRGFCKYSLYFLYAFKVSQFDKFRLPNFLFHNFLEIRLFKSTIQQPCIKDNF